MEKGERGFVDAVVVALIISRDNTLGRSFVEIRRRRTGGGNKVDKKERESRRNLVPTRFHLTGLSSILVQSAARLRKKLRRETNSAVVREKWY